MCYIQKHWQGHYSIGISFWANFLLVTIAYHYGENLIPFFVGSSPMPFIISTMIYLIISRLIIYPWQVIGLLNACGRHLSIHGDVIRIRAIQAIVIFSLLGTFIHILETAQSLIGLKNNADKISIITIDVPYALALTKDGRLIHLKGAIDFGVTKDVAQILTEHPKVTGIILDSSGGIVYEGRGLFKLIKDHGLDTYCFKNCSSACTIAFIGGTRRFLGKNAKLGFHQYLHDSDKVNPVVNIEDEQKKDLTLYKSRMISDAFINKIFEKPTNEIWFPTQDELLAAGVVDRIVNKVYSPPASM
jgi:ATP-dependent protease ClpP protease subunit